MSSLIKDELLTGIIGAVAECDECTMAVYKDDNEIVRHVGFVLTFDKGQKYTVDYGSKGIFCTSGEHCKLMSSLAEISLKTKQDKRKFIKMIDYMINNCSPTYNLFKPDQNCRGYVLRHIPTVCETYEVSSAYQLAATNFIEAIKREDIELVVATTITVGSIIARASIALYKWFQGTFFTADNNNSDRPDTDSDKDD